MNIANAIALVYVLYTLTAMSIGLRQEIIRHLPRHEL